MSEVKYGWVSGGEPALITAAIGISEVFEDKSGHWMSSDAAGYLETADDNAANLLGWGITGDYTTPGGTEGLVKIQVDISCNSVYRMPADVAPALTDLWECCDIIKSTNTQQADIGEGNELVLWIMAINIADVTVDVHMTPSKKLGASV